MKIKHSSTGVEYNVNGEMTIRIRQNLIAGHYDEDSAGSVPPKCIRNGDTVFWANFDTAGGPQPFTNGHGQTGATSSTSAANSSTGSTNARNGATGT